MNPTAPNLPPNWSTIWRARVADAQLTTRVTFCGVPYNRVRYGDDHPDGASKCGDCGVQRGQYHVVGCSFDRCPICSGQVISCGCADGEAGDDDEEEMAEAP